MFSPPKTTTNCVKISLDIHKLMYEGSSNSKLSPQPLEVSGLSTVPSEDGLPPDSFAGGLTKKAETI